MQLVIGATLLSSLVAAPFVGTSAAPASVILGSTPVIESRHGHHPHHAQQHHRHHHGHHHKR